MLDIVIVLTTSAVVGFITGWTARMLDNMMDYGNIFDFVRLYFAKRAAKRAGVIDKFNSVIPEMKDNTDFSDRMDAFNSLYWEIAAADKLFVGWVCIKCIAIQKILTPMVVAMGYFLEFSVLQGAAVWLLGSVFTFITLSINE